MSCYTMLLPAEKIGTRVREYTLRDTERMKDQHLYEPYFTYLGLSVNGLHGVSRSGSACYALKASQCLHEVLGYKFDWWILTNFSPRILRNHAMLSSSIEHTAYKLAMSYIAQSLSTLCAPPPASQELHLHSAFNPPRLRFLLY